MQSTETIIDVRPFAMENKTPEQVLAISLLMSAQAEIKKITKLFQDAWDRCERDIRPVAIEGDGIVIEQDFGY